MSLTQFTLIQRFLTSVTVILFSFFIDHSSKQTTWEDPRQKLWQQQQARMRSQQQQRAAYNQQYVSTWKNFLHLIFHYNDITWASWHLKITYNFFFQQFVWANIKENLRTPCYGPLWEQSTGHGRFPPQRARNIENISMPWRLHVLKCFYGHVDWFSFAAYTPGPCLWVMSSLIGWDLS